MRRALLLAAVASAAACGLGTGPGDGPPLPITSLPRELTDNEQRASTAANQFALTLFRRLNEQQPDSNVFVSPLSVSFALGMVLNGTAGVTFDQMRSTLGFGSASLADINDGYKGLLALQGTLDPTTRFQIANSVWYRQGFPVEAAFMSEVQRSFDAEVRATAFDQTTLTQVNDWVSAKTETRIPEILDEIDPSAIMFLINAIYFKGSWRDQFAPSDTRLGPFEALDGSQQVSMMTRGADRGKARLGFHRGATIGELSYGNSAFVMTLIIPDDVNGFANLLDSTDWTATVGSLGEERGVQVLLPKFRLEYDRELKADLRVLGIEDAFVPGVADFTRMSSTRGRDLYLAFVKHKTFVEVNEEGTEAAAVTGAGIGVTSAPPCICATRPFIFVIRERFSGTILFMGKIVRIPD